MPVTINKIAQPAISASSAGVSLPPTCATVETSSPAGGNPARIACVSSLRSTSGVPPHSSGKVLVPANSCCREIVEARSTAPRAGRNKPNQFIARLRNSATGRIRQGQHHHQRSLQVGRNEYYSPNFLNLGAWGTTSIVGQWTAPSTTFMLSGHRHVRLRRVRPAAVAGKSEMFLYEPRPAVRQWYPEPSYNTWKTIISPKQGVHAGFALLRHQPVEG